VKKFTLMTVIVALACGICYAEPRGGKEFEGETLSARTVKKLQKAGEHRYKKQFMTHNACELKHEIDLLNMLNSLYLTETQMNSIIIAGARVERDRRKHTKEIDKLNKTLEKAYAQMRKQAMAGQPTVLSDEAKTANTRLRQIRGEVSRSKLQGQEMVKAILTENQIEKVFNYEHCLIPVKNLRDPTRIGQADAASANEKTLTKVRAMSDEAFEKGLAKMNDCHIKKIEKKCGEMAAADRKKEIARFTAVLKKARTMSDLDYEFNRSKIGAELSSDYHEVKDRMKHVRMRMGKVADEQCGPRLNVVGSMFLSPNMLHILAKRTNISSGFKGTQAVDLDKIENAATNAGGCAID